MTPSVVLLANPTSGGGRGAGLIESAAKRLYELGYAVDLSVGRDAADALRLLRTHLDREPHAVVALGGDGMVSLVVQELAGTTIPLAIVPAGTGNDIARALGLSTTSRLQALEHLAEGRLITMDLGRAGDRWFAGVLGAGFDSRVNERANAMRWPRGRSRYNVAIVRELSTFRPVPFRIELDDDVLETEAMLVAVGNTPSYGGGMKVCPDASHTDGVLDVTVVGAISKPEFLRVFPKVYRGTHVSHPAVTIRRSARVRLVASDLVAYADGERVGPLPVDITTHPAALVVAAPALAAGG